MLDRCQARAGEPVLPAKPQNEDIQMDEFEALQAELEHYRAEKLRFRDIIGQIGGRNVKKKPKRRFLHLHGLPPRTTEEGVRSLFQRCGRPVVGVKVSIDPTSGACSGAAIVEMATAREAIFARGELDGSQFDGFILRVTRERIPHESVGRAHPSTSMSAERPASTKSMGTEGKRRRRKRKKKKKTETHHWIGPTPGGKRKKAGLEQRTVLPEAEEQRELSGENWY